MYNTYGTYGNITYFLPLEFFGTRHREIVVSLWDIILVNNWCEHQPIYIFTKKKASSIINTIMDKSSTEYKGQGYYEGSEEVSVHLPDTDIESNNSEIFPNK